MLLGPIPRIPTIPTQLGQYWVFRVRFSDFELSSPGVAFLFRVKSRDNGGNPEIISSLFRERL